jgi:hypothetical protein
MKTQNQASAANQAEGTLMQRSIQLSFDEVEAQLPLQLASRQLAAFNA